MWHGNQLCCCGNAAGPRLAIEQSCLQAHISSAHHQPLQYLTTATLRKTKRQPSMPSGLCAAVLVAYSAPEGQCAGSGRVSLPIGSTGRCRSTSKASFELIAQSNQVAHPRTTHPACRPG